MSRRRVRHRTRPVSAWSRRPRTQISSCARSAYAGRLLEDYPEGVGYLLKERVSDTAVLGDVIKRIAEGECVIDPTIASRLMSRARGQGPPRR
jgi:DNA-binding NarL/FixJ family response regulator